LGASYSTPSDIWSAACMVCDPLITAGKNVRVVSSAVFGYSGKLPRKKTVHSSIARDGSYYLPFIIVKNLAVYNAF